MARGPIPLVLAACGLVGCAHMVREPDLFHPGAVMAAPAKAPADGAPVAIARPGGVALRGYLLPEAGARARLLYCYGNAETAASVLPVLRWLRDALHVEVLCVDYRGYGGSGGVPSLRACADDSVAAFDWLRSSDPRPIVVYGRSLGAAMATWVASMRPAAAVILEAPPSTVADVLAHWSQNLPWYVRWCVHLEPEPALKAVEGQPVEAIAAARMPLLVLHGDHDQIIPQALGRKVFAASPAADKRFVSVPGADHNDLDLAAEPARGALERFLADCVPDR